MKKNAVACGLLACSIVLAAGCATIPKNTITQLSTIDAVLAGAYDGRMACGDLLSHGDFGIGTFDRLDGEMILLDRQIYQVRADGKIYRPAMSATTPLATAVSFKKDLAIEIPGDADFKTLSDVVDKAAPNMNLIAAVKVKGRFLKMKTRSVPAQTKPYPPLVEVTRHQPVYDMENVSGAIVGFRTPEFMKGLAVPGYHLHFVTDDRTAGGHVLEFVVSSAVAEIDVCNRFSLILPADEEAFAGIDLSVDRSADMNEAER